MSTVLKYYVYGHWHISICALVLYCGSAIFFNGVLDLALALHVSAATMFIYTCHRLFSSAKMSFEGQSRYSFAHQHKLMLIAMIIISLPVTAVTYFMLERPIQYALIISGIISLGYIMPLIFRKRLRDIGFSKIILISMVWATLPILTILDGSDIKLIILLFAEHFFFIFALTLPFDVRDQELDNKAQVSNLANTIGLHKLKVLLILCITLAAVANVLLYLLGYYNILILTLTLLMILAQLISTIKLSSTKGELYYLFYLDSFILIKGLIYWLGVSGSQAF